MKVLLTGRWINGIVVEWLQPTAAVYAALINLERIVLSLLESALTLASGCGNRCRNQRGQPLAVVYLLPISNPLAPEQTGEKGQKHTLPPWRC